MADKGKEEQFVVSDRRKFTSEGELRGDARVEEAAPEAQAPPSAPSESKPPQEMPAPPSAAEQSAQQADYKAAGKQIDSMLDAAGAKRPPASEMEMTFEKLVLSLYMTAMMQMGMVREENTPPQPDIIGARQTIDTIALLGEKTKGNLTDRESHLLQNCLFELRMAFLEIMKVITTAPPAPEKK